MNVSDIIDAQVHIKRGSVYLWHQYPFTNSKDVKDKYWITLNCLVNDFPINAILPTSQWDNHYYTKKDNRIDTVIFEKNESEFFKKKTVIDLKNIIFEEESRVREGIENNFLKYQGLLEDNLFKRIEEAIRGAVTLSKIKKNEYLCID